MPLHHFYDIDAARDYKATYDVNPLHVTSVRYFRRYLLHKAMSVFKWTIPENWDMNYFLYSLYVNGYVAVTDVNKYGVICQLATITGFNIYYNPSRAIISNPYISNTPIEIQIGKTGEILTLTPDYSGLMDTVQEYAEMLANASAAVNTNLYNSRLSYIFYAKNKNQAESYKKMYDQIGQGKPAVFTDAKLYQTDDTGRVIQPFEPFNANLSQNYITSDVLEDMRRIEHMFAQKVGLPNTNTEKKERLNVDETNKADAETIANVTLYHDTILQGIERIKKLYPDLNLSCDFRFNYEFETGGEGVNNDFMA